MAETKFMTKCETKWDEGTYFRVPHIQFLISGISWP
jgi:hypothetical protein